MEAMTSQKNMREVLDAALSRLATFLEGRSKTSLLARAKTLSEEIDACTTPSSEAAELLQRRLNLLHVVLVKAAPRRRKH